MNTPKVSIIMPSLNVGPFIRECIDSAVNQTLRDIEIICVDAGSTDGTAEILQEYAGKDSRIRFVHSDVRSYGYQMNLGLDAATGEYIGILETDDWAECKMFEMLYAAAKTHDADLVKSNYYWYTTKQGIRNEPFENLKRCPYNRVFSPVEERDLFHVTPSIWSGIYRRSMLLEQGIRFNETPGASFQDTSFHFMLCTVAKRVYLMKDHYLHYRRDNDGSSVHSASKVFCVADEMHYYEAFLEKNPQQKELLQSFWQALKYEKYRWNYDRLNPKHQYAFLRLMHREFFQAKQAGLLEQKHFGSVAWRNVNLVADTPIQYFRESMKKIADKLGEVPVMEPEVLKRGGVQEPLISVIIPMFNVQEFIGECLNSILTQSVHDIEVICINDGSMDGTLELVQELTAADERVTIVDQINAGQSAARNVGISLARGQYLYFMDSDDYIVTGAFERLLSIAQTQNTDILYFGAESFFEDQALKKGYSNYVDFYKRSPFCDEPISGDVLLLEQLKMWQFRCSVPLQFIRREFLAETGLRFEEGIIHEDELFSCLLAVKGKRNLCIRDELYMRRVRGNSTMTAVYTARKLVGFFVVATRLMANLTLDDSLSQAGKEALAFHANKIFRDVKNTYWNLPETEKDEITKLLPTEYLPFYAAMEGTLEAYVPADHSAVSVVRKGDAASRELMLIKRSSSYRIGRIITHIPRKLKRGVKCIRDHGFAYTVGRGFRKLGNAAGKAVKLLGRGMQCCKDHGIGYTLKRAVKKLRGR